MKFLQNIIEFLCQQDLVSRVVPLFILIDWRFAKETLKYSMVECVYEREGKLKGKKVKKFTKRVKYFTHFLLIILY